MNFIIFYYYYYLCVCDDTIVFCEALQDQMISFKLVTHVV